MPSTRPHTQTRTTATRHSYVFIWRHCTRGVHLSRSHFQLIQPSKRNSKCKLKAPDVEKIAWLPVGIELDQNRPWLGLVDLSRIPSGTFFREVHPASEMGCKHRQNRLFPDVGDLAPKARKTFFTKVRSQRAHFFVYRRPQGIYADLTSKLQREQTTGTPPFCFPSVVSPI